VIFNSVPVLQAEGRTIRCKTLGAMWIFLILVSLSLVFMLYALVHFFRDGRQRTAHHDDRSGSAPAKKNARRRSQHQAGAFKTGRFS
jgi:hypothetical protein